MSLVKGQLAPDFNLFNTEKQEISLSAFSGKNVVLLFFPFAFSRVCTTELCSVRDNIASYNNVNAEVLGISVDSLYSLAYFKKVENLNFTLLSDFNKEVAAAYGTLNDDFGYGMKGVSKRAAFVVNKSGTISYAEVLESDKDQPDFQAISEVLNKLT